MHLAWLRYFTVPERVFTEPCSSLCRIAVSFRFGGSWMEVVELGQLTV